MGADSDLTNFMYNPKLISMRDSAYYSHWHKEKPKDIKMKTAFKWASKYIDMGEL